MLRHRSLLCSWSQLKRSVQNRSLSEWPDTVYTRKVFLEVVSGSRNQIQMLKNVDMGENITTISRDGFSEWTALWPRRRESEDGIFVLWLNILITLMHWLIYFFVVSFIDMSGSTIDHLSQIWKEINVKLMQTKVFQSCGQVWPLSKKEEDGYGSCRASGQHAGCGECPCHCKLE